MGPQFTQVWSAKMIPNYIQVFCGCLLIPIEIKTVHLKDNGATGVTHEINASKGVRVLKVLPMFIIITI